MKKLICLFLLTLPLSAHDFWIEPSNYHPQSNSLVKIRLWVGNLFHGLPYPRNPNHIERFISVHSKSSKPIVGFSGRDPAGLVRVSSPGIYILGYHSKKTYSKLDAAKFELFLREEGQEHVLSYRRRRREKNKPGREYFFRYAKSLIVVGKKNSGVYGQILDFPLELVPQKNPFSLNKGEKLPIQLLFKKKPLAQTVIAAIPKKNPEFYSSERSNQKGVVFLDMDQGTWLIKAVHVVKTDKKDTKVDWHSYWASLTFSIKSK